MEDTFDVQLHITSTSPYWTMNLFEMEAYLESVNACIDHNVRHIGYIRAIDVVRYFGESLVDDVSIIPKKYFTYGFIYPLATKLYVVGSVAHTSPEPSYLLRCAFNPICMVKPCDVERLKTLTLQADGLSNELFDKITELAYNSRKLKELFHGKG